MGNNTLNGTARLWGINIANHVKAEAKIDPGKGKQDRAVRRTLKQAAPEALSAAIQKLPDKVRKQSRQKRILTLLEQQISAMAALLVEKRRLPLVHLDKDQLATVGAYNAPLMFARARGETRKQHCDRVAHAYCGAGKAYLETLARTKSRSYLRPSNARALASLLRRFAIGTRQFSSRHSLHSICAPTKKSDGRNCSISTCSPVSQSHTSTLRRWQLTQAPARFAWQLRGRGMVVVAPDNIPVDTAKQFGSAKWRLSDLYICDACCAAQLPTPHVPPPVQPPVPPPVQPPVPPPDIDKWDYPRRLPNIMPQLRRAFREATLFSLDPAADSGSRCFSSSQKELRTIRARAICARQWRTRGLQCLCRHSRGQVL